MNLEVEGWDAIWQLARMANEFSDVKLTAMPLEIAAATLRPDAGAVVEFLGVVRALEGETPITGIFYEGHSEMAEHQLRQIAEQAATRFGCSSLVLHHRLGFVPVAEASLFIRVMARHRDAAFEACRWVIEELKKDVPIWKRPVPSSESP